MKFGERLKILRSESNETQESISKVLHVSRQTISNWENERSYPDIEMLIKLSDYYNVSLDQLLREDVIMQNKVIDDSKKKRRYRNIIYVGTVLVLIFTVVNLIWLSGIWSQNKYLDTNWKIESVRHPEIGQYSDSIGSQIYVKQEGNVYLSVPKESISSLFRHDYLNFKRNTMIDGAYVSKEDIINTVYFDKDTFLVYIQLEKFMESPLVEVDKDFKVSSEDKLIPIELEITHFVDTELIAEANSYLEKYKNELIEVKSLSETEYQNIN